MTDTLKKQIEQMEKEAILNALEERRWVRAGAARKLGITERMIGYTIKKYGLEIKGVTYGEAKVINSDENDQRRNNNLFFKKEI
jgi:hypothetical protein